MYPCGPDLYLMVISQGANTVDYFSGFSSGLSCSFFSPIHFKEVPCVAKIIKINKLYFLKQLFLLLGHFVYVYGVF